MLARIASGQRQAELTTLVNWFMDRVDDLTLGTPVDAVDAAAGSVLQLFDAGGHRRGMRPVLEEQVIALFDKAATQPDETTRDAAFERLWDWAAQLGPVSMSRPPRRRRCGFRSRIEIVANSKNKSGQ